MCHQVRAEDASTVTYGIAFFIVAVVVASYPAIREVTSDLGFLVVKGVCFEVAAEATLASLVLAAALARRQK